LQQFTFVGDSSYGKSNNANTDDHPEWVNDILPGWQRDVDFEQRKWKPVVSEREPDQRSD
jgi:hypothetical protein